MTQMKRLTGIIGLFFRIHDPSTVDRQGNDRGSNYRSALFIQDEQEGIEAEEIIGIVNEEIGSMVR